MSNLLSIPPWLQINPSEFVDAARAGAQIGLSQQDAAERALENAQRNSLSYAQLGEQQRESDQRNQTEQQDTALRSQDLLTGRQDAAQQRQDAATELDKFRQQQLGQQDTIATENQTLEGQKIKDTEGLNAQNAAQKAKIASDTAGAADMIASWNPSTNLPPPSAEDVLMRYPSASPEVFQRMGKNSSSATPAPYNPATDNSRRRLAADYILKQQGDAPTNSLSTVMGQYDSALPAAAPASQPTETAGIPTVNSQSDYDALPAGSQYLDSNGQLATKKATQ